MGQQAEEVRNDLLIATARELGGGGDQTTITRTDIQGAVSIDQRTLTFTASAEVVDRDGDMRDTLQNMSVPLSKTIAPWQGWN